VRFFRIVAPRRRKHRWAMRLDELCPAVTTAPPNGKVATLEELAQMVRRRKPRPKAMP
jgi:hypothetical protein